MDTLKKVVFLGFGILVSTQGFVAAMESSQVGSSSAQEVVVAADDDDSELPHKRGLEKDADELAAAFVADQPRAKAPRVTGDTHVVATVVPYDIKDYERARAGDKNLVGAHLMGANLRGFDFLDADLTDADLSGANLAEAKFNKNSKLIRTKFIGAHFEITDLSETVMDGIDASGAIFNRTIFFKTKILNKSIFWRAEFKNLSFRYVDIQNISFVGSFWNDVEFLGSRLLNVGMNPLMLAENLVFNNTDLLNVHFSGSTLHQCIFMNNSCLGDHVDFSNTTLRNCSFMGMATGDGKRIEKLKVLDTKRWVFLFDPTDNWFEVAPTDNINSLMSFINWKEARLEACHFCNICFEGTSFENVGRAPGSNFESIVFLSFPINDSVFAVATYAKGEYSKFRKGLESTGARVNGYYAQGSWKSYWEGPMGSCFGRQLAEGFTTSVVSGAASGAAATAGSKVAEWAIKKYVVAEAAKLPAALPAAAAALGL